MRLLASLALGALLAAGGACSSEDAALPYRSPAYEAANAYCPDLLENCPLGSHPVTGARAAMECADPKIIKGDGWVTNPSVPKPGPEFVLGQCRRRGDCLVYCRLPKVCVADQLIPTVVCR